MWKTADDFATLYGNHTITAKRVIFGIEMAHKMGVDMATSSVTAAPNNSLSSLGG